MYYYTVYKVTNQINGKFYVGTHKTKDLNDNYMGSGKYLKRSQEKHGIDNFTKEILFVFDNPEEMYAKEAEIVNEEFLAEENTYNLKVGGRGGFDYLNDRTRCENTSHTKEHSLYMLKFHDRETQLRTIENARIYYENKIKENGGAWWHSKGFSGMMHTEESKKKIAIGATKRSGDKNGSYGTFWINKVGTLENKKVPKGSEIPEGWMKGRKL